MNRLFRQESSDGADALGALMLVVCLTAGYWIVAAAVESLGLLCDDSALLTCTLVVVQFGLSLAFAGVLFIALGLSFDELKQAVADSRRPAGLLVMLGRRSPVRMAVGPVHFFRPPRSST